MKRDRHYWKVKLNVTKALWRSLRPTESQGHVQVSRKDFWFESVRIIAPKINFESYVSGWQIDDSTWSLRVRAAISDVRVSEARSFVVGRDTSKLYVLDFDILAASSLLRGEKIPASPLLELDALESDVLKHLKNYIGKIDYIWNIFGGCSAENIPKLAIWVILNRATVGAPQGGVPMICAAHIYGEKELSLELLAEFEADWDMRLKLESNQSIADEMRAGIAVEIDRLRILITRKFH